MGFVKRYLSWTDEGKTLFWLIVADIAVFLALIPFFLLSNMGIPLGWLLGSVAVCLCYLSMIKGTGFVLKQASDANGRNRGMAFAVAFSLIRLFLMAGVLIFAAFMTFKVEGNFVNFFSTAAAYLPLILVSIVFTLTRKKQKKAVPASEPEKDLEVGEEPIDE